MNSSIIIFGLRKNLLNESELINYIKKRDKSEYAMLRCIFIKYIVNNNFLDTANILFQNVSIYESLEKNLNSCEYNDSYYFIINKIIDNNKQILEHMFIKYSDKNDINDDDDLHFSEKCKFWYNFFRFSFKYVNINTMTAILVNPLFSSNKKILIKYLEIYLMESEICLYYVNNIKLLFELIQIDFNHIVKSDLIFIYLIYMPEKKLRKIVDKLLNHACENFDNIIILNILEICFTRLNKIEIQEDILNKLFKTNDKNIINYLHKYLCK